MSPRVLTLLLFRREGFSTHRAQMSLSEVQLDVLFHCLAASKPTSAVFAAVWLLARVNTDVLHQLE